MYLVCVCLSVCVCVLRVFGVFVGLFVWYMHVCEFLAPLCVVWMCVGVLTFLSMFA